MRILYVLTTLGIGGAEKQVVSLAERMALRGHAVAFLVLKHADEEWPVKLPVMRLNMRKSPSGVLKGLRFAKQFVGLFRPDVVHSHTFPANIFARLLRLTMLRQESTPLLLNTIHNVYEGGWHRMLLYRITHPLCHAITAVSSVAAARFRRWHAVPAGKLSVVTNGIDTQQFTPDRKRRKQTRLAMQASVKFIWLAVGRIVPAKDYPNLLRAFALLYREEPKAELWIAGEGDAYSIGPSHLPAVRFLGVRRDIPDLLDAADAYVLSSKWEGMPLALGEAMAMEKPVVATDVGGVRELGGSESILVPASDSEALAAAMLAVLRMGSDTAKFRGRAARSRIQAQFSMDAKADAWEQLYLEKIRESTA